MKPLFYAIFTLIFSPVLLLGQIYTGPIARPTSGYGSDGGYTTAIQSFANPNYPTEDIRIYYPSGISSSVPTIFYSHGFGGYDPLNILGLLNFVAKKGYAIVFVPYQTNGVTVQQRYNNLLQGFIKAARDYPSIIDTSKVGFMGHSFGGGAVFANSYHCFTQLNWGQSGRFIFSSAQWYSHNISQAELLNFPTDVKLLSMVYEDDITNDQRIANDIFNNINIPLAEKDYLMVKSDTVNGYTYDAIHGVPNTLSAFDALDYYAIYRHLDALCDYTFNGNLLGKDVALGNGSVNQVSMPGGMHNLIQSDNPNIAHPDSIFTYPCNSNQNPRQAYCGTSTGTENIHKKAISFYPNPAKLFFTISYPKQIFALDVLDCSGKIIYSKEHISEEAIIHTESFPKGLYLLKIRLPNGENWAEKLVVE